MNKNPLDDVCHDMVGSLVNLFGWVKHAHKEGYRNTYLDIEELEKNINILIERWYKERSNNVA